MIEKSDYLGLLSMQRSIFVEYKYTFFLYLFAIYSAALLIAANNFNLFGNVRPENFNLQIFKALNI